MNIILFGPPGSGKGTQADNLVKEFNFYKVSTGDMLRNEIKKNTSLSEKIKEKINQGLFMPDSIINDLVVNILSNKKISNKLVFDGYPRNINQANKLDSLADFYNKKVSCVFSLNVDKEIILKRILGRIICSNCGLTFNKYFNAPDTIKHKCDSKFLETRPDDNKDTIISRFDTYSKETLPVINHYSEQGILHQIDGMREINQIYQEIRSIFTSLET